MDQTIYPRKLVHCCRLQLTKDISCTSNNDNEVNRRKLDKKFCSTFLLPVSSAIVSNKLDRKSQDG